MNTNKKCIIIILLCYLTIIIFFFLFCPILETSPYPYKKIDYLGQIKEGFFFHALFWIFIYFVKPNIYKWLYFENYSAYYSENWNFLLFYGFFYVIFLFTGIFSIVNLYKKKKIFPYIIFSIISIILFCMYMLIGTIFFIFRYSD